MNVIGEFFVWLVNNYFYFEKLLLMVLLLFVCLLECDLGKMLYSTV